MWENPLSGGFFLDNIFGLCHYKNIMAQKFTRTEEQEQMAFVQYCQANGWKLHHSANEVGGSTAQMKMRAIKAKRMGTSRGFPDLLVFIPIEGVDYEVDAYQPIAVEMKRTVGSVTSPAQKEWGKILNKAGIPFRVCKGCEEAISFVKQVMGGEYDFED